MSSFIALKKCTMDLYGRRDDVRALKGIDDIKFTDAQGNVWSTTGNVYRVAYFKKKDITRIYFYVNE